MLDQYRPANHPALSEGGLAPPAWPYSAALTDGTPSDAGSDAEHESPSSEPGDGAPAAERTPRKRRRRRGRGRHGGDTAGDDAREAAGPRPSTPTIAAPPPAPVPKAFATLAAGLFSHIDDRQVPCKMDGCDRTWTWSAAEQIQAFGQPPPRRMCAEHYALHHAVLQNAGDREVRCSNPWCDRTWTWPKSAQLALLQRNPRTASVSDLEPPARACDACTKEDRELADAEVACRVDGCKRTWTWSRDAQLKHRAWLRHAPPLDRGRADDRDEGGEGRRRRRRRRGAKSPADPPPRMCEPCRQRLAMLVEREGSCKVHGCTRTVTIDRESQLRAWAALGTTELDVEAPLPKRMCEVCREFCRLHGDREVPCGRPGCDRTWTYKTGAQLQAFLAGRFEDPLRLCDACMSGAAALDALRADGTEVAPEGAEVMPCVVIGCDGVWYWIAGMSIAPANDGDQPFDRMCARCRAERGQAPDVQEHELEHEHALELASTDHAIIETASEPSSES